MLIETPITQLFNMTLPIIQAPMAGGGDTPDLVATVSEAGGLGFLGCAYLTATQINEAAQAVRSLTDRPFGVNLFAPQPNRGVPENTKSAIRRVAPFFREIGLEPPARLNHAEDHFEAQLTAGLQSGASIFSFAFGIPPSAAIDAVKSSGMVLMGTATKVEEAVALEQAGFDVVVAQGSEAGGHRSTFLGSFDSGLIGTVALVPQTVDAVKVPVVASGGIADGRGIAAALALGAGAVQIGTAFLTCEEAGFPDAYKAAILGARDDETSLTRAFSGRPARGVVNRFMKAFENQAASSDILPFPYQNQLTRPLRNAAAKLGRAEFLSLWAGQALKLTRRQQASDLMVRLAEELDATLAELGRCASTAGPSPAGGHA